MRLTTVNSSQKYDANFTILNKGGQNCVRSWFHHGISLSTKGLWTVYDDATLGTIIRLRTLLHRFYMSRSCKPKFRFQPFWESSKKKETLFWRKSFFSTNIQTIYNFVRNLEYKIWWNVYNLLISYQQNNQCFEELLPSKQHISNTQKQLPQKLILNVTNNISGVQMRLSNRCCFCKQFFARSCWRQFLEISIFNSHNTTMLISHKNI